MSDTPQQHFYPEIEGIRGILSLIVLYGHVAVSLTQVGRHPFAWYWGSMEVFFCISGYLICWNFVSRYATLPLSAYFINRALRIWPLYYFAWAFAITATVLFRTTYEHGFYNETELAEGLGGYLPILFLQNTEGYFGRTLDQLTLFAHSWSVALEEQFYVIVPILFVLLRRRSTGFVICAAALAIIFTTIFRYKGFPPWTLVARFDGFALGILLAFLQMRALSKDFLAVLLHRPRFYLVTLTASVVLLAPYVAECYGWPGTQAVYFPLRPLFNPHFTFALFAFAVLGLISTQSLPSFPSQLLASGALQFLGRISYSTYLLHIPIVLCLAPVLLNALLIDLKWLILLSPALSIGASTISYYVIEKPFLKWKVRARRDAKQTLPS